MKCNLDLSYRQVGRPSAAQSLSSVAYSTSQRIIEENEETQKAYRCLFCIVQCRYNPVWPLRAYSVTVRKTQTKAHVQRIPIHPTGKSIVCDDWGAASQPVMPPKPPAPAVTLLYRAGHIVVLQLLNIV